MAKKKTEEETEEMNIKKEFNYKSIKEIVKEFEDIAKTKLVYEPSIEKHKEYCFSDFLKAHPDYSSILDKNKLLNKVMNIAEHKVCQLDEVDGYSYITDSPEDLALGSRTIFTAIISGLDCLLENVIEKGIVTIAEGLIMLSRLINKLEKI